MGKMILSKSNNDVYNQIKATKAEKAKLPQGVFYDEDSKTYGFRIAVKNKSGKKVDTKRIGFNSAAQAKREREKLRNNIQNSDEEKKIKDVTFNFIHDFVMDKVGDQKKATTLMKQESLWKVHLQPHFGERTLASVSKGELDEYLLTLFTKGDIYTNYARNKKDSVRPYKYRYVESFLKMFYLFYGVAYDYGYVDADRYRRDFQSKGTKLKMPDDKKELSVERGDDGNDDEIVTYTHDEIKKIFSVVNGTIMQIPVEIALFCGLRRSEIFGLLIDDVDLVNKKIHVRWQLLYDNKDKLFYVDEPKTVKSSRTVDMPDLLVEHLRQYLERKKENEKILGYRNTEIVYNRTGKGTYGINQPMQGAPFLFRKANGELITVNSMKYWVVECRKRTGINLRMHALRHTNATYLAGQGIPLKALMNHLGHTKVQTTMQYYVRADEDATDMLRFCLNKLANDDTMGKQNI